MPIRKALYLLILLSTTSACATRLASGPDLALIQKLPVVRMGTPSHGHKDYILHVPKGQVFPIDLTIDGGPFKGAYHEVINAALKQDMYLYQHWGSYDGKRWQPLRQMLGLGLSMGMDTSKAFIKVELSELGK